MANDKEIEAKKGRGKSGNKLEKKLTKAEDKQEPTFFIRITEKPV